MGMFDDLVPQQQAATAPPGGGGLFDDLIPGGHNTYDEAKIRTQGAAKRSEGVNPDGSIPGMAGNLDRSKAGDNWSTIGTAENGLNLTRAVPGHGLIAKNPAEFLGEQFRRSGKSYGAFETDQAAADAMNAPVPRPSLTDRFKANAGEGFFNGTLMGGLANLFDKAMSDATNRNLHRFGYDANIPDANARFAAPQQQIKGAYENMPSFATAPGFVQKAEEGLASLAGQVVGGGASPESFAGLPERGAVAVEHALAPVIKNAAVRKTAAKGVEQAAVNVATDPATQGLNIAAGTKDNYDPIQTALAGPLGFLIGGGAHGLTELAGTFRKWRAGAGAAADSSPTAAPTPEEIDAFSSSPELKAFAQANGITDPKDPRAIQLEDRLATRRAAEAQRGAPQSAAGSKTGTFKADQARLVAERQSVEAGATDPAATSTAGRIPPQAVPEIVPVDTQGRADIGDPGIRAGVDLRGRNNALVPLEPRVERMTPEDIERSRAKMDGGNPNTAETPDRFVAPEDRSPQSIDQNIEQRKSADAFRLAELQRSRSGPEVRDTQPAARAEGSAPTQVALDEGFPVQILERSHKQVGNRTVEMARVHRYDPRTGALDPEGMPYDVPVSQLKTANYAKEPRLAQDYEQRAKGPAAPELPRMADEGVRREPAQTYRTTPPHPNEEFPGAASAGREGPTSEGGPDTGGGARPGDHVGRSPLPESPRDEPPNKGSFRQRPTREAEVIREFEQRQREEEARKAAGENPAFAKARPTDSQTSTEAKAPDADKRFEVDDRGFVASSKGGPVRFVDQKQAAKWIINVGHKTSPDQIFEIANHPVGKGFTVRERGRAEPPSGGGGGGSEQDISSTPDINPQHSAAKAAAGHDADVNAAFTQASAKAASDLRNRFYSNPIADPEIWKELGRVLKNTAGWVGDQAQHFAAHLKSAMESFRTGKARDVIGALQIITDSTDGRLRSVAARYKSKTISDIADMFHSPARAVGGKAVAETYHEAVRRNYSTWMNRLGDLLEPIEKLDDKDGALDQIGQLIRYPGAIKAGTPVHDAAAGITKILKEALGYMREAGVKIGEIKNGYLPRIENVEKVLSDKDGFKAAAAKAYMADGVPAKDAREAADEWFQRLAMGDIGVHTDGNDFLNIGTATGQPKFSRGRVLSKKADTIMKDFYLANPADIMPRYIMRAAKRAEWARRMGPDLEKWKEMKSKMIEEGAGEAVPGVIADIKANLGELGGSTGAGVATRSFIRTWATLRLMPHSLWSSLTEPAIAGLRSGNPLDSLRAFGTTIQQWVPALRKIGDGEELRQMGEHLGYVGDAVDQLITMQRNYGPAESMKAREMTSRFFRSIGLTQLTDSSRLASMKIGNRFVYQLAQNIEAKRRLTLTKNLLSEMGIPDAKHEQFAQWVRDRWEGGGPNVSDILEGGEMGRMHQVAVGRFIDQSIQAPTNAMRPRYAADPVGAMFYHLLSFTYAFQKNVVNRALSMAKFAATKGDLSFGERLGYAAPILMMPAIVSMSYGLNEIRNALLTDPARYGQQDKTPLQKWLAAVSRSNVDGIFDVPLNILNLGGRYSRDPADALAGPIWGNLSEALGSFISLFTDANSPNTNTAERKGMRELYDNVIMPTLEAGGLKAAAAVGGPLGLAAAAASTFAASHPGTRETVVGAMAGEPVPKGGGGGRPVGRSGGREGGRKLGR